MCEKNCEFIGYDKETKKSQCNCEVKTSIKDFSTVVRDKDKLLNNFIDFKSTMNFDIVFCVKTLFCVDGIKNNIGSYVLLLIITINIANSILFPIIGYKNILSIINNIIKVINKENIRNINIDNENKYNDKNITDYIEEKEKAIGKTNKLYLKQSTLKNNRIINFEKYDNNSINLNLTDNINSNFKIKINTPNNINSHNQNNGLKNTNAVMVQKETKNKRNNINNSNYTDNEINSLDFNIAVKIDKRSYLQYYISLLKTKHIAIFTFYTKNDNNSRIIKLTIFLFSFALLYTVNSLFFQDSTMHRIYEDYGAFNFVFQLPQIIYSTIISSVISLVVKNLSLTEKQISGIKKTRDISKKNTKIKCLKIKLILFFILIFILLGLFWYYLSCFGAVYKDTQIHLLKDTLISFGCSLIYPFGLNLIPGILRVPALKRRNKILYAISTVIQML